MDPEPGEVVFFHGHPSWLALAAFYAKGLALALVGGVAAGLVSDAGSGHVQAGWIVLVVAVVFVLTLAVGQIRRIQTTYSITDQRLTIETGLLSKNLHQTRLERVQNVNASQSLVQRMVRIGTVDFDTAGETEFDFSFRGVAHPRAIVQTVDRALHELRGGPDARAGAGL